MEDIERSADVSLKLPDPPGWVRAASSEHLVRLNWSPSPSVTVERYIVVRKVGSKSISPGDGEQVAIVESTSWEDTSPQFGVPVYYSVFASNGAGVSIECSSTETSTLIPLDVIVPTTLPKDGAVDIRWTLPPTAESVHVIRAVGAPPYLDTEGILLNLQNARTTHVLDTRLDNGVRYFYRIQCVYRDERGAAHISKGVVVDATPEPRPPLVTELMPIPRELSNGYIIEIGWKPLDSGEVRIIKTDHPPSLEFGQEMVWPLLRSMGQVLEARQSPVSDYCSHPGIYFYTAASLVQRTGMAYVGATSRCVCAGRLTNLRAAPIGRFIRITWTWPKEAQEVDVFVSRADWPEIDRDSDQEVSVSVSRDMYEQAGNCYLLPVEGAQDYFIIAIPSLELGNSKILDHGERARVRIESLVVLEYEFRLVGKGRGQRCELVLQPRSSILLPPIIVVSKRGAIPLSPEDGEVVCELGTIHISGGPHVIALPSRHYRPETLGRVFFSDDHDYERVRILQPPDGKARLG